MDYLQVCHSKLTSTSCEKQKKKKKNRHRKLYRCLPDKLFGRKEWTSENDESEWERKNGKKK